VVRSGSVTRLQLAADRRLGAGRDLWRVGSDPHPSLARILVESNPTGVTVAIDGEDIGETPLGILAPAGQHQVGASHAGYESEAKSLELTAGSESRLSFDLEALGGTDSSKLNSRPSGTDLQALLEHARSAMSRGDWSGAAHAYRQIHSRYPNSPESRTIVVTLGQLELDRLGQPARALSSFQSYLRGGGPLSREARLGEIRALRKLGQAQGEARAIGEYLQRYSGSAEASRLRTRLNELQGE
jgi:hypothetical protein